MDAFLVYCLLPAGFALGLTFGLIENWMRFGRFSDSPKELLDRFRRFTRKAEEDTEQ